MSRPTLIMTIAVLFGFAILLFMNVAAFFGAVPSRYISPNDVKNIAVEHNGKPYILNFEQQTTFIDIINRSLPVSKSAVAERTSSQHPEVQKIIVYRFDGPEIEITPIAYVEKTPSTAGHSETLHVNLVFSVPEWNADGFLEESAADEFHELLSQTYDH